MPKVPEDEVYRQIFEETIQLQELLDDKRKTKFGVFDDNDQPIELFEKDKNKQLIVFVDITFSGMIGGTITVFYNYFVDKENTKRIVKSYDVISLDDNNTNSRISIEIDSTIDLATEWGYNVYMTNVVKEFLEQNL